MRTGVIYALKDPRNGAVRYIGKTVQSVGARRGEHIREAVTRRRQSEVHHWTRFLVGLGLKPEVHLIEDSIPVHKLNERESFWIRTAKDIGIELYNYTNGGNGALVMSDSRREHQARITQRQGRDEKGRFLQIPT